MLLEINVIFVFCATKRLCAFHYPHRKDSVAGFEPQSSRTQTALQETQRPRSKSCRYIAMETRMNTKNGVAYLDPTMLPRVFKDVEPQTESNPEHMDFSIRDRTLHSTRQIAHGLNQLEAANPLQPSRISSSFPSAILSVKTDARCSCQTDPPLPCILHPS